MGSMSAYRDDAGTVARGYDDIDVSALEELLCGAATLIAIFRLRISNLTPQLIRRAAGSLCSLIVSRSSSILVVEFLKRRRCSCVQDEDFHRHRSLVGAV